jgi:hypothetical protein
MSANILASVSGPVQRKAAVKKSKKKRNKAKGRVRVEEGKAKRSPQRDSEEEFESTEDEQEDPGDYCKGISMYVYRICLSYICMARVQVQPRNVKAVFQK